MDDHKDNDATDPELIGTYRRADALEDGELVDVTEAAREAGFLLPVALTRSAWALCVALSPAAERACHDEQGRLWDVLWMMRSAIGRSRGSDGAEILFEVLCVATSVHPSGVVLRCVVGPDGDGEPVVTLMLPDES
jgi:hypothetical protein